jgi:cellulose synthase/poly-beta-1,6-N-acetylglucosamine synthase-like glycosyltransferase
LSIFSVIILVAMVVPLAYLYLLAFGALRRRAPLAPCEPCYRFAVAIPAHDESLVIGQTVTRLHSLDYRPDYLDIYVVADHCTDETAFLARQAGAICFERKDNPRSGKGAALGWLFARIWETGVPYDAVIVFDADTQVDVGFLRAMASRLSKGEPVIQGQHRIRNPQDGWFPALTWAMFLVDNRFQNWGRASLGLSAMNMGDSICFRSDILRQIGWGEGQTEDYDLRLRLLLHGIRIAYEPAAIGYGEAPATWAIARRQRQRWLTGRFHSTRAHLVHLLRQALHRCDPVLLDGVAQMIFPSYSTLTVLSMMALLAQLTVNLVWHPLISPTVLLLWSLVIVLLLIYPFLGLTLERAPLSAYAVILTGAVFILWRTWLAIVSRLSRRSTSWVRTPRRAAH